MSLDHLWAGWRSAYVENYEDPTGAADTDGSVGTGPSCTFCGLIASDATEEERFIVSSGPAVVAILNLFPYAPGHLLVMPKRHVRELDELSGAESTELWAALGQSVAALKRAYRPDGCNIGANLGRAAGAGIPGHLHLHAVPRWQGDTNFMTATAAVRVLPEAIGSSWAKLRSAWR
jgi:ATP adenylyltransferase